MSFLSQFLSYSSHIVSLAGNTAGALAAISTGTMVLAGGNNITLSQNGQSITISGAAGGGGGSFSAGVSGGNTSGSTGITGTRLVFAGGNNITLSQSTDANGGSITFSAFNQSAQPSSAFSGGISNLGNTAGSSGLQSSQLVLAGGNNITLSGSTAAGGLATVTISAAAQTVESQTAGISNLGNTSGTTGVASGAQVRFLLAGGNNVTLSQSLNGANATVTISAASQSAESQSAGISNLGNTAGTSGIASGAQVRLLLAGGNNITLSQSLNGASATVTVSGANQTAESNTLGISNLGNTAGTSGVISGNQLQLLLAGGNNITLSQSINGSSATITISAGAAGGGNFSAGVSGGNTSGSTGITGSRLVFAGGNNITLSQSTDANGGSITISAFNQSADSQSIGMSNLGNTSGTSGIASGDQVRFVFAGGNNITLSQSLNGASGTITISAFTQSAESQSAGISNLGNTAGTSGIASGAQVRLLLAGGNNITLSQSLNGASATVTISAPNQTAESNTFGMSNLGNTAGTSGVISGNQLQMIIVGSNNITVSQSINGSSATMSIIGGAGAAAGTNTLGISNLGNTSGTSGVITGTGLQLVLAGGNNITLSQSINGSSATVTISAANAGAGAAKSVWGQIAFGASQSPANLSMTGSSSQVMPFYLPYDISADFFRLFARIGTAGNSAATVANSTASGGQSTTFQYVLYTLGTGANSQSLQSIGSSSFLSAVRNSYQMNTAGSQYSQTYEYTYPIYGGTSQSTTQGSQSTSNLSFLSTHLTALSGNRALDMPFATSLSAGAYWLVLGWSTASAGDTKATRQNLNISAMFYQSATNTAFSVNGATTVAQLGGVYSNAGAATTGSIAISQLTQVSVTPVFPIHIIRGIG